MSSKLIARSRNLCVAGFALLVIALIPDQLAAQRGGSDRGSSGRGGSGGGFQGRGGSTQGRGGSTQGRGGSTQGRGGSTQGRGGSTQGRGGSDRGSSTQGRGGSSGGMSDFISRMDTNGNGNLDPDEQGRLRPLLERISSARRDRGSSSLDLSRPIPISRLSDEMNRMRQQREQGGSSRGSSGGGSNLGRGDSGSLSRTDLPPLVPDFAFEDEVYIPLPSFGPEGERNTVKVTEADRKEAAQTMKRYDRNSDNILSKSEIAQARWRDDPLQQDRNRDGRLTLNELSLRYALRRTDNTDSGNSNRSSNRSGSRDSSSRSSSSRNSGSSSRGSSSGRDSGSSGRGSSSGSSSDTNRMAFFANSLMQRYDENGSGVLEKSEWKSFRTDPSAADTNKDSKITKDELTKWMGNRMGQRSSGDSGRGRGDSGGDSARGRGRGDSGGDSARGRGRGDSGGDSARGRGRGDSGGGSRGGSSNSNTPDSYRFKTVTERLPEGLPEWFKNNDANGDGQIMMSEYAKTWNAEMLDSFDKFDFNADGVITPDECLDASDDQVTYNGDIGNNSSRRGSSSRSGDSDKKDDTQKSSSSKSAGSSRAAKYASAQMKTLDTNKDGVLEKAEWSKSRYIKENFDTDGNGKLTLEEMTKGFGG